MKICTLINDINNLNLEYNYYICKSHTNCQITMHIICSLYILFNENAVNIMYCTHL